MFETLATSLMYTYMAIQLLLVIHVPRRLKGADKVVWGSCVGPVAFRSIGCSQSDQIRFSVIAQIRL